MEPKIDPYLNLKEDLDEIAKKYDIEKWIFASSSKLGEWSCDSRQSCFELINLAYWIWTVYTTPIEVVEVRRFMSKVAAEQELHSKCKETH